MAQDTQVATTAPAPHGAGDEHTGKRLGAFLCWAVVFADIGTSVYYVPGILYGQVGKLAGLFVTLTLLAFLLLTLKYAEVSVRFPEGGGVVTVSARALNPWAGAVGGMFILVDYFLTAAISSLSGVQYFTTLRPNFNSSAGSGLFVTVLISITVLVLLGVLNWWGIKESAIVSAVIAVLAFLTDIAILLVIFITVPLHSILSDVHKAFTGGHIGGVTLLTGFAGAFLAFSGLESISQLSPVMKTPRRKTVTIALSIVVVTVGITSPLLTIFSTTLLRLNAHSDTTTLISQLGGVYGGNLLKILTIVSASVLLIFASNTAIIGTYHVFLALSRMRFFPKTVEKTNKWRGTPHVAILLATGIPILVLIAVRGDINILGDMYAFGLLGAFSLTCISLDVLRWRERHGQVPPILHDEQNDVSSANATLIAIRERLAPLAPVAAFARKLWPSIKYYLGFFTTLLIIVAWATNLVSKHLATEFGGGLTILGVGISVIHYRYQQRKGNTPVFQMSPIRRLPGSSLVILSAESPHNQTVIRAAVESVRLAQENSSGNHPLVFLYLGRPIPRDVRPMQFNDPFLYDDEAHHIFSAAASLCAQEHISAYYIYRVDRPTAAADIWRLIRPDEIIAETGIAKNLSARVAPEYVRFQQFEGIRVAHYVKRHVADLTTSERSVDGTGANGTKTPPALPPETPPSPQTTPATSAAPPNDNGHVKGNGASSVAGYVWQGTKLVKKDQRNDNTSDTSNGNTGKSESNGNTPLKDDER